MAPLFFMVLFSVSIMENIFHLPNGKHFSLADHMMKFSDQILFKLDKV